ncbi:IBR domain-containing protein, variant [Blastomyces dermatitidis ER-3]|uniref:RBR-type E3 ubiquitin transferase n=2 Tax=Blastomyces TaxID=229219 RepID=A0A179UPV5_BLAGS|nr:IBR domain-containing protein [Blastomyces gilchristii SLH14081]XP_031578276.1 IBR domain-containing protein, variant [Blastomyces gilchristii SLH14081]XP_045278948.1 IBR domain-containing protein [Blastomyces dermatitidis ER-3]XP_045282293.1 IBR domain-containing protein, variant [Blastomyces dermatitidis ER-3]EEQ92672.1 IBR domain-containing protein [Blastomyces dermatitidis ER-3]OAT02566.1 IBR domain-containing protein, variant [Blastomyces dermatitidis ER-3]OAT08421.1 IBR domain-contai
MDDQSLALTVELLRQDVAEAFENRKGKQVEGAANDAELALQLWQGELTEGLVFLSDRQMAKSMGRAVEQDERAIVAIAQEEDTAINDRRMALNLGGGVDGQHVPRLQRRGRRELDEKTLQRFSQFNIDGSRDDGDDDKEGFQEESKSEAFEVKTTSRADNSQRAVDGAQFEIARFDCTSCMESKVFFDIIETSCSHYYCRKCVRTLFEQSFSDESLFPPRCCREPISLSQACGFLGKQLAERFEEKLVEHNDANRTYCSNPVCSIYLPAKTFELNVATCRACQHTTCVLCKKTAHSGPCADEKSEDALLDLIQTEKWQQCFRCRSVVELRTGCYHITCRCRAEFCYLCGAEWKNCKCEQWDDDRLLERGQQIALREQRPGDGPVRPADVNRAVAVIRERHDCFHLGRWQRIDGRHRCEECMFQLPNFILQCQQCRLRACVRCRHNRL